MGFAFPKVERDSLVATRPDVFVLPALSDLRYQWVEARLAALDPVEMRELVTDAWRMCVPRMLHDLPELPAPGCRGVGGAGCRRLERRAPAAASLPDLRRWPETIRGRTNLARHLTDHPRPRPRREVEVRDGQIHRWLR